VRLHLDTYDDPETSASTASGLSRSCPYHGQLFWQTSVTAFRRQLQHAWTGTEQRWRRSTDLVYPGFTYDISLSRPYTRSVHIGCVRRQSEGRRSARSRGAYSDPTRSTLSPQRSDGDDGLDVTFDVPYTRRNEL